MDDRECAGIAFGRTMYLTAKCLGEQLGSGHIAQEGQSVIPQPFSLIHVSRVRLPRPIDPLSFFLSPKMRSCGKIFMVINEVDMASRTPHIKESPPPGFSRFNTVCVFEHLVYFSLPLYGRRAEAGPPSYSSILVRSGTDIREVKSFPLPIVHALSQRDVLVYSQRVELAEIFVPPRFDIEISRDEPYKALFDKAVNRGLEIRRLLGFLDSHDERG